MTGTAVHGKEYLMTTLTYKCGNMTIIIEKDEEDVPIDSFVGDLVKPMLLSIGYHPTNVESVFCDECASETEWRGDGICTK
jgi:hypothetical protein